MKHSANFLQFSLLFVLMISVLQPAKAQQPDSTHSLADGARALQFQVTDNFNLSSFNGSFLSYKKHLSDRRAHRAGLSFWSGIDKRDDQLQDDNEQNYSGHDVEVSANFTWMRYTNPDDEVKFYYGFGPGINFDYDYYEGENANRATDRTIIGAGISALGYAGVEWFFHPSFSLHAEYRGSARFNIQKEEENEKVLLTGVVLTNERDITSFTVSGNGVRFGLSVYF